VVEGSPANGANRIEAPVLLAHADRDVNVAIQHSDKMAAALQHAGKQVEYYRIKGLDHQLADSSVRATLLLKMGQLLDRTIGH
jgi:dipeptidyl aminopeptidase/acylaminoacyl peptidase